MDKLRTIFSNLKKIPIFIFSFTFFLASCGGGSGGSIPLLAISDNVSTYEDTALEINVLLNDSYQSSAPIILSVENGSNGIASVVGNLIIYNPDADYYGTDNFNYTITQENKTSSAEVNVTINSVNDAPFIETPSNILVDENKTDVVTVSVSDVDKDDLTLTLNGTDANSFNLSNENVLTFKEAPDYETKDSYFITLTVSDEIEETSKNINVTINDLPELNTSPTYPLSQDEYDFNYFNNVSFSFFIEHVISFSSRLWGLKILTDSYLLTSEQNGFLHLVNIESQKVTTFDLNNHINLYTEGQGGIFNFSFKKISENYFDIYFLASVFDEFDQSKKRLTLFRLNLDLNSQIFSNPEKIYEAFGNSDYGHFGGAIEIINNSIIISSGDRHCRSCPQDIESNLGKILRFNIDENNNVSPHAENSVNSEMQEIFSIGHRNPQGIEYIDFFDKLLSSEHGPLGGDEINFLIDGENYGWPLASTGSEYSGELITDHIDGMQDPITYYSPAIAPRDLIYVHENELFPELDNSILLTSLIREHIIVAFFDRARPYQEIIELKSYGRISSIDISEDGEIYFATHHNPGTIFKITR